jgi:hypothetical protein
MATHHGNAGLVKVSGNTVAEVRSFELETAVEVADDTVIGDTWHTHLVNGNKSWKGQVECFWDETDSTGQEAMDEGDSISLALYPEAAGAGASYYSGTATITGMSIGVPKDGIVTRTITFQGNGALTRATV